MCDNCCDPVEIQHIELGTELKEVVQNGSNLNNKNVLLDVHELITFHLSKFSFLVVEKEKTGQGFIRFDTISF